jgi:hypothetical protein
MKFGDASKFDRKSGVGFGEPRAPVPFLARRAYDTGFQVPVFW